MGGKQDALLGRLRENDSLRKFSDELFLPYPGKPGEIISTKDGEVFVFNEDTDEYEKLMKANGSNDTTWTGLVTRRTAEPISYDVQPTYEVLEYTYGDTKYYRKVMNNYSPTTDIFYGEPELETVIASRALSI